MHPKNHSHTEVAFNQAKASAALLPPDEAGRWVARLEKLRQECGCTVGARFFITALVVYPAVWYWLLRPELPSPWYATLVGVVFVVLAAGLGKITGVLFARRRLRLTIRSLEARVAHRPEGACAQLS